MGSTCSTNNTDNQRILTNTEKFKAYFECVKILNEQILEDKPKNLQDFEKVLSNYCCDVKRNVITMDEKNKTYFECAKILSEQIIDRDTIDVLNIKKLLYNQYYVYH
jgi:hypothetical protein